MTRKEFMQHMNISRTTLYKMEAAGLPVIPIGETVGSSVRIDVDDAKRWMVGRKNETTNNKPNNQETRR